MIIQKTVKIKWNPGNKKRLEKYGYVFHKWNEEIEIKVNELTNNSNNMIQFECDFCGEINYKEYKFLCNGKNCCNKKECRNKLREETNLRKYGVRHVLQSKKFLDKAKDTCQSHFGVEYPMQDENVVKKSQTTCEKNYGTKHPLQNSDILHKAQETCERKFGNKIAMRNETVKQKAKDTCREHLGVDYPMQSKDVMEKSKRTMLKKYGKKHNLQIDEIKEKVKQTVLSKYGVENAMQNEDIKNKSRRAFVKKYKINTVFELDEVQEKAHNSLYVNGNIPCSATQRYLCDLLHGELNYPFDICFLDIALINEKIDIEYDGTGHDLCIRYGKMSAKKFYVREIKRDNYIKQCGWKIIRIKCMDRKNNDKLFADEQMINLINICKDYLLNTKHRWININIDDLKIESTEYNVKLDKNGNIIINKK